MVLEVTDTAVCKCSFGLKPYSFTALPKPAFEDGKIMGNIMDILFIDPTLKMPIRSPFGKCISPCNPKFLAQKKPVDCEAVFTYPWIPGSPFAQIDGKPALTQTSILICQSYRGVVQFITPGDTKVNLPG